MDEESNESLVIVIILKKKEQIKQDEPNISENLFFRN